MVNNSFCICKICNCKLRLRYQVGNFNIPVSIYCPECNSHIFGEIIINQQNHKITENLNNVIVNKDIDYDYVFELSTEFLSKKCTSKNCFSEFEPTIFIKSNPFDSEKIETLQKLSFLINNKNDFIEKIENISNLSQNKNVSLFIKFCDSLNDSIAINLKRQFNFKNIKSYLDCLCISKYYINSLISPLMVKGTFDTMNSIMNNVIPQIINKNKNNLKKYLKVLMDNNYFDIYINKIPKYIVQYCKVAKQFIPVYGVYNHFETVDLVNDGITTIDVEEIANVYKNGFELLCDSIDVLAGLYNIERYGFYNLFDGNNEDFISYFNRFHSKYKKYIHLTSYNSNIFKGISNKLNNIIRNSEGHNSIEINGKLQNIIFINKHQGKENKIIMTFIEFSKQCIELFNSILIIYEFYYQLYKLKCLFLDSEKPNITTYFRILNNKL